MEGINEKLFPHDERREHNTAIEQQMQKLQKELETAHEIRDAEIQALDIELEEILARGASAKKPMTEKERLQIVEIFNQRRRHIESDYAAKKLDIPGRIRLLGSSLELHS